MSVQVSLVAQMNQETGSGFSGGCLLLTSNVMVSELGKKGCWKVTEFSFLLLLCVSLWLFFK